ncbi:MAG: hypothetical protein WBQ21_04575 [Solirubrobacteraceae bacterium]
MVVFDAQMTVLACMMHWYASAMFVVPVAAVGGWSWWSTRRAGGNEDQQGPAAQA